MNLAGFEQCAGLLVEQLRRTVQVRSSVGRNSSCNSARCRAAFSPWMVVTRTHRSAIAA
ncbi:MAG: hypothetical protein ACLT4C_01750 [Butyricicoccus sp.]